MINGISIYEILTLTTIIFFIGVYGFITRKNLISILMSVELILNASVINFVIINKYLYPDILQGVFFSIFSFFETIGECKYKCFGALEKETEVLKIL